MPDKPAPRKPGHYITPIRYAYLPQDQGLREQQIWRLPFPTTWEKRLSDLQWKYGLNLRDDSRPGYLPYRSLNSTLLLAAPTMITFGFDSVYSATQSSYVRRLLITSDPQKLVEPLTIISRIWAKHHFDQYIAKTQTNVATEARSQLDSILQSFQPQDLAFESYQVNLAHPELDGRVQQGPPAENLYYKALPVWLVDQFAGQTFELGGFQFTLYRTQIPGYRDIGVELMSWPPLQLGKGFMSLVLQFVGHTLPEQSAQPLIYPHWHVRRWVHRSLVSKSDKADFFKLAMDKKATVYLQDRAPWLKEILGDQITIATTNIRLNRTPNGLAPCWEDNISEILTKLGWNPLFDAKEFIQRPARFTEQPSMGIVLGSGQKGLSAKYPIGDGLFLRDVQELMDQLAPRLSRLGLLQSDPGKFFSIKFAGIRKPRLKTTDDLNELDSVQQTQTRQALEDTLPDHHDLIIEIRYINTETALALWSEVFKNFGLSTSFISPKADIFSVNGIGFETPEKRRIRVVAMPNQFQKLNITDDTPAGYRSAVQDFVTDIRDTLSLSSRDTVTVSFVELRNFNYERKRKEQLQDAKAASRFGYAVVSRLTQFIEPVSTGGNREEQEEAEKLRKNKARAAVLDLRRQLGFMESDLASLLSTSNLPVGTQLIGFHLEQQNITRKGRRRGDNKVFFPAAVKLTIGQRFVQALVPDANGDVRSSNWLSYTDAALQTGILSGKQLTVGDNSDQKQDRSVEFLSRLIELIEDVPTILFVSANTWRNNWKWLQDSKIRFDQMEIGNTTFFPAGMPATGGSTRIFPNLRVVRFRENEVPSYLTLDLSKLKQDQAGHGHGIMQVSDRIFYSIASKPDSYQKPYRFSRVGEGRSKDARISALLEVTPVFVQKGDDPFELVKIFHFLRAASSHWKEGMINQPLPCHLAERMLDNYLCMRSLLDVEQTQEKTDEAES